MKGNHEFLDIYSIDNQIDGYLNQKDIKFIFLSKELNIQKMFYVFLVKKTPLIYKINHWLGNEGIKSLVRVSTLQDLCQIQFKT